MTGPSWKDSCASSTASMRSPTPCAPSNTSSQIACTPSPGLIELGDQQAAIRYALEVSGETAGLAEAIRERIEAPEIAALLIAKTTVAAERDVELVLSEDSRLARTGIGTNMLLSIVGNLIDNAIDAAATGPGPARVTVRLVTCDGKGHPRGLRYGSRRARGARGTNLQRRVHDQIGRRAPSPRNRAGARAPARDPGRRHRHRRLLERHNVHGRAPDAGKERRRGGRVISTLIVEDDYHVATIHAAYVRKIRGFSVAGHASTAASARTEIRRLAPTLVLLDLYLPDGHGLDLVRETLGGKGHRPDFLVITAARDMGSVRAAMQLGTVHYLVKPFTLRPTRRAAGCLP